jgi:gamma-glutamyltranspeptidase/glutathione hydrolase
MILNNELTDFSFAPEKDGAARRQPRRGGQASAQSSMAPTLVYGPTASRVVLAVGAAGGATIIMQVAKALIGVLDWGLPSAGLASRCPRSFFAGMADTVFVEQGTALETMIPALGRRLGHDLRGDRAATCSFKANADRTPHGGRWRGGADPRSEGAMARIGIAE